MTGYIAEALAAALDDEYRAKASYQAVIAAHGPAWPFVNIVQAEQRHINALVSLFQRYGLALPYDRWDGNIVAPATLQQACEAGVAAEIANYQMYDRLLQQVSEPDIHWVFTNLRNASAYHHLPAFQACSGRTASTAPPLPAHSLAPENSDWSALWLGLFAGAGIIWWLSQHKQHNAEWDL